MTRWWAEGIRVHVHADEQATPVLIFWEDRPHRAERICERWRVETGWWIWPIWREYFRVTTHFGLLIELYHDLLDNTWYVQRVYD